MATRDELVRAVSERYGQASRAERGRIWTSLHRKHAMRLLRGGPPSRQSGLRLGRRVYDVAVREALIVVWEASDRGMRQMAAAAGAAARPPSTCAGGARRPGVDERRYHRPGAA